MSHETGFVGCKSLVTANYEPQEKYLRLPTKEFFKSFLAVGGRAEVVDQYAKQLDEYA